MVWHQSQSQNLYTVSWGKDAEKGKENKIIADGIEKQGSIFSFLVAVIEGVGDAKTIMS